MTSSADAATHYDLIVVGAGSGNMLLGPHTRHLRTAIVEPDRFGGTCLNRGCIPSKMLVVTADLAQAVRGASRLGVNATLESVDWPAVLARVFGRIDPLHSHAVDYRRRTGTDVFTEPARFVARKVLEVGNRRLTASTIVLAAGARPTIPDIPGLSTVPFHTSDTIMRIEKIPESLLILGGGVIAAEMGHVFDAFGANVTIVAPSERLLMNQDEHVSRRFTELAHERFTVLLNTRATQVTANERGVSVTVERNGVSEERQCSTLLVATGRRPNTDRLDVEAGGLEVDEHGHVRTDDTYRTSVPGVWALGDLANHFQLKHMANAEERIVAHNMLHPDRPRRLGSALAPHAVFSEPQIATVGITEQDARRDGIAHVVATRDYADTAYGWALEDTTSFVKIIADPHTRLLLGAHIIGPQASLLIQPAIQAMMLGQTVDQLAREVIYIHPALTEVLEQALLEFPPPAATLS
jgi:mycothione reductase